MFLCCYKLQIANKSLSNFSTRCLTDVSATPLLALGPSHGRLRWSSSSSSNSSSNSSSISIWRASPTSALDSSAKMTTTTCPLLRRHRHRSSSNSNKGRRLLCSSSNNNSSNNNSSNNIFRVRCSSSPQLQLYRHEYSDIFHYIFFPNFIKK